MACNHSADNTRQTPKAHSKKEPKLYLSDGEGQRIASRLGCMNCHLTGETHMTDDLDQTTADKKYIINLNDLCSTDSMVIYNYAIKYKHKGIYKNDIYFKQLKPTDISNLIYYLHSCKRIRY